MIFLKLLLLLILIAFLVEGFYKVREGAKLSIAAAPAIILTIVYTIICLI